MKKQGTITIKFADWIALLESLNATPDLTPRDLALKATRLRESCTEYALRVVELERMLQHHEAAEVK